MANVERILQLLNEVWIEKRLFGSWKSIFFHKVGYSAMFVHRICLSSKKLTNSTNSLDSKIEKVKKCL